MKAGNAMIQIVELRVVLLWLITRGAGANPVHYRK